MLGPELADFACKVWGVTEHGNFEGHNILFCAGVTRRTRRSRAFGRGVPCQARGIEAETLSGAIASAFWPGRDEKILTAWNGLMIAAFARAGAVFGDERFLGVATSAADFILGISCSPDGRLFRSGNADGSAKLSGYLEDYTLFADALVTLFEAKFDSKYLRARPNSPTWC